MLIQADARRIPLADNSVQCVVTSPPYFGLRDYGIAAQIGLEPTPDIYVQTLVQVFKEVRRVLSDDGVVWINLGDSYAGSGKGAWDVDDEVKDAHGVKETYRPRVKPVGNTAREAAVTKGAGEDRCFGLKSKDLIGIPWRVAFALQADGWYLRSDVIWSKPNPMPESVTDRPTKAHEYLFLLTKSEQYYYDAKAIAEPVALSQVGRVREDVVRGAAHVERGQHSEGGTYRTGKNERSQDRRKVGFNDRWDRQDGQHEATRNKRSVWTVNTQPYAEAHFATMPEALVEPCILAGSRLGDLVFDPFSGSGTVLAVAERLSRRSVGTDLNPEYHALAKVRTAQRGLRFA